MCQTEMLVLGVIMGSKSTLLSTDMEATSNLKYSTGHRGRG